MACASISLAVLNANVNKAIPVGFVKVVSLNIVLIIVYKNNWRMISQSVSFKKLYYPEIRKGEVHSISFHGNMKD